MLKKKIQRIKDIEASIKELKRQLDLAQKELEDDEDYKFIKKELEPKDNEIVGDWIKRNKYDRTPQFEPRIIPMTPYDERYPFKFPYDITCKGTVYK